MAGRAKENLPGGSLKYQFLYSKIRIFKCSYHSCCIVLVVVTCDFFILFSFGTKMLISLVQLKAGRLQDLLKEASLNVCTVEVRQAGSNSI